MADLTELKNGKESILSLLAEDSSISDVIRKKYKKNAI